MHFDTYQELARRTQPSDFTREERWSNAALGLGEAGELQNLVKKHLHHKHPLAIDKIVDEAGDILWYLSWIADLCGFSLDTIAQLNVAKLRARYPEGFSSERSINRKG